MVNEHIGSLFTAFLDDDGIAGEVTATAVKRVLAWQLEESRRAQGISKSELARQLHTSRTQVDRLLDPENTQVQLETLQRAARALGRTLVVELK